jgi:hypothetical protein
MLQMGTSSSPLSIRIAVAADTVGIGGRLIRWRPGGEPIGALAEPI